jgi:hypothetical protein
VFVLLTDPISRDVQERWVGGPADPGFWAACTSPALREIGRPGYYVIFRIEAS